MNNTRQFHIGDILSVTTGVLLSSSGEYPISGVYEILSYMTNDDLYTHAIPRAMDECRPYLHEQLPFTRNITKVDVSFEAFLKRPEHSWINGIQPERARIDQTLKSMTAELVAKYGEFHAVRPIHPEDHEVIDPFDELRRMNPNAEIITLTLPDDASDPR